MSKNIVVIYSGGTFGMQETDRGLRPLSPSDFKDLLGLRIRALADHNVTFVNTDRIIDSSQATISDWNKIGEYVDRHYTDADGLIVIHGTDTMDYFCAALDAMFTGLDKPVVCVGSMKSLISVPETDAIDNFQLALNTITEDCLRGVLFAFDGKVFQPDTIFKYKTQSHDAFRSVVPPLVDRVLSGLKTCFTFISEQERYRFLPLKKHYIPFITFTPGDDDPYLQCRLDMAPGAIVLEGLGNGNIPATAHDFLKDAQKRGIPVFAISAAPEGVADATYEVGSRSHDLGVVPLGLMPRAACLMKLQKYLTRNLPASGIIDMMRAEADKLMPPPPRQAPVDAAPQQPETVPTESALSRRAQS